MLGAILFLSKPLGFREAIGEWSGAWTSGVQHLGSLATCRRAVTISLCASAFASVKWANRLAASITAAAPNVSRMQRAISLHRNLRCSFPDLFSEPTRSTPCAISWSRAPRKRPQTPLMVPEQYLMLLEGFTGCKILSYLLSY